LNPLFVGAESLKGVGAGLSRPLDKLGLTRVRDFLYHLPDRFVSRRVLTSCKRGGRADHHQLTVLEHRQRGNPRAPFRIMAEDNAAMSARWCSLAAMRAGRASNCR
jgi:ATP-dependent DNA helicase RecG